MNDKTSDKKYKVTLTENQLALVGTAVEGMMNDLISRKALLEEIENGIKAGNYEEGYEEYPHINDMDDIIECIKYADSVQPKPKTDVLDKIRAEIEALEEGITSYQNDRPWIFKDEVLQIIDKYKAESEDKEWMI